MNQILKNCYLEEDLFPKLFTKSEERPYGILFYNPDNRDSYDSNHAVIYKDKIDDLSATRYIPSAPTTFQSRLF